MLLGLISPPILFNLASPCSVPLQVSGHLHATLDPLGHTKRKRLEILDPAFYGFTESDMDREFYVGTWNTAGFLNEARPVRKLREVVDCLERAYCSTTGIEYMHITDRERCNWIRERVELYKPFQVS